MFKTRKSIFLICLVVMFFLSACSTMQTIQTPKEKAIWMFSIYNAQYSDYQTLTGHVFDTEKNDWVKVSSPDLSEDQKKILNEKKKVLTEVYPLILLYDSYVSTNTVPSEEVEQKIIGLLNSIK